ncbi:klebicin B [Pseudocitrobacter sp. RIT415]|nr:klebicin B [Pseudocitrobacter sp. RIT 415]
MPEGYWLSGGKVMKNYTWYDTTTDGTYGHGTRTVKYSQDREVPELTQAWNQGVKQRQDAAAKAKAEAAARALKEEEAKALASGMTKAEFDAKKSIETAQAAVVAAQGNVNTLTAKVNTANQSLKTKQSELAALNIQLKKAEDQVKATLQYANVPGQDRLFFNAQGFLTTTKNSIKTKQTEISTATTSRDSLNKQLVQANTALQNAKKQKTAADAALAAATKKRQEAEAAAAAAKKAADDARAAAAKAKALQDRQAVADRLKTSGIQSVRGVATGTPVGSAPLNWSVASVGGIALDSKLAASVWSAMSAALAELRGIATASLAGPVAATIGGLLYSPDVGKGSDQVPGRDISALIPTDALSLPAISQLNKAADTHATVDMPIRGQLVLQDNGTLEAQLVRTPVPGKVPVVRAVVDKSTGYYSYALPAMPGAPAQTILISPANAPGVNGQLVLEGPVPLPEVILHTGDQSSAPETLKTTVSPAADDPDFRDIILVFPDGSGLKPLYIMFRSPRNLPGQATGKGQQVGDNWLGSAGVNNGAPIPSQIADKLRGKSFSSFDSFRRALWKAVADDPTLSKQFSADDLVRMKLGRAPTVKFRDSVGKRVKVELHHNKAISEGGDVYNMDNLNALTPKRHIEIHKGK